MFFLINSPKYEEDFTRDESTDDGDDEDEDESDDTVYECPGRSKMTTTWRNENGLDMGKTIFP